MKTLSLNDSDVFNTFFFVFVVKIPYAFMSHREWLFRSFQIFSDSLASVPDSLAALRLSWQSHQTLIVACCMVQEGLPAGWCVVVTEQKGGELQAMYFSGQNRTIEERNIKPLNLPLIIG